MKLSAPVYYLKRQAKHLARTENVPLHDAQNRIAAKEGFHSWSLLAANLAKASPADKLQSTIALGELVLLAARPGHGKTLLGLELLTAAIAADRRAHLFSLEYTTIDVASRLHDLGIDLKHTAEELNFDTSDAISADYMISQLQGSSPGSLIVVDYLQLLDQKRENPPLDVQIRSLHDFARQSGVRFVFLSQISRDFDLSGRDGPEIRDIRLPNPIDLTLIDWMCFLNNGDLRIVRTGT